MKSKLLHSVPLSILLIASYCGLLIFVAIIRFVEYRQAREAARKINEIAKISNRKLDLLIRISQNYSLEQKAVFERVHLAGMNRNQTDHTVISPIVPVNDNNFSAYKHLIGSNREQTIFTKLLVYDSVTSQVNDSLVLFAAGNSVDEQKLQQLIEKKASAYTNFDAANHQLLALVSEQSRKEIADTNNYLILLARRKEFSSYIVILLLLVLGLTIGNTLRKLRRTERNYRLLFDLSPLPKYIIDPTDYHIQCVNTAAVRLYGYSKEEFSKLTPFVLRRINGKEKESFKLKMQPHLQPGNPFMEKARHYKKNGEAVDVEIISNTIFLREKKLTLVTINNITEKEKLDKKITKAIIKTQEDERQKLGAELHDNIGQILATTQLFLSMGLNAEQEGKQKYFEEAVKYLGIAVMETRNISHRIYPAFLEELSFPEAISNLLYGINADRSMQISFEHDSRILTEFINPEMKLNIYRILQEQLKNIQKYSKATEVGIELKTKDNWIYLKISDNGVGFDVNKIKPGIGLLNMRKRAELFFGKFLINAAPNKGCTLLVEIPLITDKVA